ncbi:MAG: DNA-3-methyladenine glycosylase I [Candidatus Komeilibacteria bacterium CG_4_9_14_0_8_um_filter_36_9]|uniref:DNA-3-methyladenine glycosylase I n=1 Tax=Candidatus Komeilibacteria bacterium CG_4_9_14_0_8_um_filter_36_9 TaxID=1974473 RepID=A0A2M8DRD5_9BACT|nr:MAG: DNA-3-methyladenine glycosylase I [Candidatus Komeilibacteria bacterium CG_4_9_14_0_8_um_filter_36_9]
MKKRCAWCETNEGMIKYHDTIWGVPVFNDRQIFEFFVLDTFQAGLSWNIIWQKREGFKKAFANFDPKKVAQFKTAQVNRLLGDISIVRNRLKIHATINNAQKFLAVKKEYGTFAEYLWQFTNNKPIINKWQTMKQIPVSSKESDAMSKDLKVRGFKFVGTTICYAFMQGIGMVNDHVIECFRYSKINKTRL